MGNTVVEIATQGEKKSKVHELIAKGRALLARKREEVETEQERFTRLEAILQRWGEHKDSLDKAELTLQDFQREIDRLASEDSVEMLATAVAQGWNLGTNWENILRSAAGIEWVRSNRESLIQRVRVRTLDYAQKQFDDFVKENREALKEAGALG